MKQVLFAILLIAITAGMFYSCAKYKDSKPVNLNLTNPYCNDPNAVNYNVGFPGKPDSAVCTYPANFFTGTYIFHDSVFNDSALFLYMDSLVLRIYDSNHFTINVHGFCPDTSYSLSFTATTTTNKIASCDTDATISDTTTLVYGQTNAPHTVINSNFSDTINGTITIDALDSNLLHISFMVVSDSGINTHIGSAAKQ